MAKKRLLASWIGHMDLRAMAVSLPKKRQEAILKRLGSGPPTDDPQSPVKTLVDRERFDETHLLSNYEAGFGRSFAKWLGPTTVVHEVEVANPTDYPRIFSVVEEQLAALMEGRSTANTELCIHLSPGTPAMAAVWVLLGKSKFPATFYQTFNGKAWETDIPFDLVVDYVPELLRHPDAHLQQLASKSPDEVEGFGQIVGKGQGIRLAVGRARRAAIRDVSVLLVGESGTGKELFARAIHTISHRKDGPFHVINCAAIPKELLESEIFGHKKDAFTGAQRDRPGALKLADHGTLFLDEIGDCDRALQPKLLRALQPRPGGGFCIREFQPVGGDRPATSDVRIIAATNRDILAAVAQGEFRDDLYYRIAAITIKLPPLRERKADIPLIAEQLLIQINREFAQGEPDQGEPGYQDKSLSDSANEFLRRHHWPGNVRELYNVLVQAAVMSERTTLKREDLEPAITRVPGQTHADVYGRPLGGGFRIDDLLDEILAHYLKRAMREANGRVTDAARLLGVKHYQTLTKRLKRPRVDV